MKKIAMLFKQSWLLMICLLGLVAIGYSWFSYYNEYEGAELVYTKTLVLGTQDTNITTYLGYENADGTVTYSDTPLFISTGEGEQQDIPTGDLFDTVLYPGYKQLFRTDIENNSTQADAYISLYLENILFDEVLRPYLYFGATSPSASHTNYYSQAREYTDSEGTRFYRLDGINIITRQRVERQSTVSVYWYIHIDTDLGNEGINSRILLDQMRILYG